MLGAVSLLQFAPGAASAQEWAFVGARYQGMGGTGVAMVDDEHASYWNPGALAFTKSYGVALPVGAQVAATGSVIADIDRVANFLDGLAAGEFDQLLADVQAGNTLTSNQLATAIGIAAVRLPGLAESGEGLVGNVNASLLLRYGRFAVSGVGLGHFAADPVFDRENLSFSSLNGANAVDALVDPTTAMDRFAPGSEPALVARLEALFVQASSTTPNLQAEELVFQAQQAGANVDDPGVADSILALANATIGSTAGTFEANNSGAFVRGLAVEEIGFGYGHPFLGDRIGIGGNVKYMVGTTFNKFVRFDDVGSGSDLISDISDARRRETTHTASLDLGILVKPWEWLRFGLTARNVTSPEFDLARDPANPAGKNKIVLDPQVRIGAALWILPNWAIAIDADLTKNESDLLDGFESQFVSLGTEFKIPIWKIGLALRGGAYLNTAAEEPDEVALTGGLGIHFFDFNFDLAVGGSPKTERIEAANDRKIPSRLNVSAMLSFRHDF